ncbi:MULTISPECIES: hypothetical protein [unclassified Alteromonas]|uniref:hypothetical protein n=1 Tax=unclassified Alteromonas TaxID=2614992 RepID=UPI000509A562|nr:MULTISPECIES: hypothetical protein [unclassified Alteromonas]
MRFTFLTFAFLTLLSCAVQQEPVVEQLSENSYRITAQGPISEGKVAVKNKIHLAARKACRSRYYEFSRSKFGENISLKGISNSSPSEGWHDNQSSILEAVATISCYKG